MPIETQSGMESNDGEITLGRVSRTIWRVRVLAALICALIAAPAAGASVRRAAFTASVSPRDHASLTVTVSPAARCTIEVVYDTTVSHARGLGPKRGSRITWTWTVGSATHAGVWPVKVDCGKSGKLVTHLRVRP